MPAGLAAPAIITSDRERPQIPSGVMSGDPTGRRAVVWSKTDRPARMLVEYATREDFRGAQRVAGPCGRELEIASLLSFIKNNRIKNVVWVTADVHYAHAIHYAPDRAQFTDFDPFWEFVAGPINAGNFGPNEIDSTFGPETKFVGVPSDMKQNRPPLDGLQFYGIGRIDGDTRVRTMSLHDLEGKHLYAVDLEPEA